VYKRNLLHRVQTGLSDTRVVFIAGPRQSGKTTLAQQVASDGTPFFTLDDPTTLSAAREDPFGFVRGLDKAVIDEIQRAPELLLAIKSSVDHDPRPGRFLLTGSANLMALPTVADSLAGRMEVVHLLPLAQAEIRGRQSRFLEAAFTGERQTINDVVVGDELIELVLSGGYPEALTRTSWSRRQAWHLNYIEAIFQRDIRDIAQIDQPHQLSKLIQVLAEHSGQLANYSKVGAALDLNHNTTRKYVRVLENVFLLELVPPWFNNSIKRLVKTPKLHFLDSGLMASLRDITPDQVQRDKTDFGSILETFVFSELRKLASWSSSRYRVYHFRDRAKNEVDIVLEDRQNRIVGIEIKASATVRQQDFSGLQMMQAALGSRFANGYVLYDSDRIVPFSDRLAAMPISALWS